MSDTSSTTLTIERYLQGKVAETLPDNTLLSIIAENGVAPGTLFADLTEKQRDLCLAGVFVYLALHPTTTEKVSDSDADWSHSEGGTVYSANVLNNYLKMANAIYKKYDLEPVGDNKWGMRGGGFHNIRNYGDRNMY